MKFRFLLSTLGILLTSPSVFSDKESSSALPRQAPVFSTSLNQYPDAGNDPASQQVTIYDTLGNKHPNNLPPSESYTNSQQQGKSNFGLSSFASADSSSGYPSAYPPPASPSNSYIPLGNRPTAGYPDTRPTVLIQQQQQQQPKPEESYAYYYQHYPAGQQQYGVQAQPYGGSSGFGGLFDSDIFGGLGSGDLGGASGAALGGLGGLGALGIAGLAALAKGALALKPLLIFGVILLILLPLLILFLPIPIITIPTPPGPSGRGHQLASAVTSLTQKVLGSEECLERILCKIPPVPKKFQGHAKGLWDEYGSKVIQYPRVTRGLDAYFNSTDVETKHRAFKCNTQFKCSNKLF